MINPITFLNATWFWPVILGGLLLWFVFLWKEYAQSGKRLFILKAIVSLLGVCSLVAMVLQPLQSIETEKEVGVVLTKNYKQSQLDSLTTVLGDLVTIDYDRGGFKGRQLDSINETYILGDGVENYDFWQLENIKGTYLKSDTIAGIVRWKYNPELFLGDSLTFSGLFVKPVKGGKLVLQDNGGNGLDSITFDNSKNVKFSLQTVTKVAGQFLYKLVEKDSLQATIIEHPIPVSVGPRNKLSVLILNTFPTFESKYLKNFLAESGHEVLVRSQLTKEKYKFESFNREQRAIYGLTNANLSNFDLVILDAPAHLGLSSASRRAVNKQIEEEGLGLFILPDASLFENEKRFDFRFKRNNLKQTQIAPWDNVAISVGIASFNTDEVLVQPILESQGRVWSAYTQKGVGRLATSAFQDTYQLVLNGNDAVYKYIWSEIVSEVSQKKQSLALLFPGKNKPYVDEPYSFRIGASLPNPSVRIDDGSIVPLQQSVLSADEWKGTIHPKKSGWNYFEIKPGSTSLPFYVFESNDWEKSKSYQTTQENLRTFTGTTSSKTSSNELVPLSRWWFFVLFAIFMGFLWLVPRLSNE